MKKIVNSLGNKLVMHKKMYYILNFTWGIIGTLLGFLLLLILMPFGKVKRLDHVLYLEFNKKTGWGFSLGTVFFVTKYPGASMKYHEFGHTVQNAIFGPFMFLFVSLPSVIRFWIREYGYRHDKLPKTNYDEVWFEGTATSIGNYYVEHKYN